MKEKYPNYFPNDCPPPDATYEDMVGYRFCRSQAVTKNDFLSYFEMKSMRCRGDIFDYGVSILSDEKECRWALNALPYIKKKFKHYATGHTIDLGAIKKTPSKDLPSHYTLWLFEDSKPHLCFLVSV